MTRPQRTDALIAGALLLGVVVEQGIVRGEPGVAALNAVGCAALLWRRRAPATTCLAAIAFLGGPGFIVDDAADAVTPIAGIVVGLFSLVAYAPSRRPLPAVVAAVLLVTAVSVQASIGASGLAEAIAGGVAFALVVIAGPAIVIGLGARRQAQLRRRLEGQAHALEHERERHAASAAAEERARVAAELHDVVAAGVRGMLADVAIARSELVERPAGAGPAILRVEERGRMALTEMRRLLGVLRRGDEDLALAPYPSLDRLASLAQRRSADGPRVSLRVEGTPLPVSAGLDVAAYRMVEDALDRAAGAAEADVVVRWESRDLELEVAVDGPQLGDTDALGAVRERVALFSGRLDAGRRPRGGSAMRVALPVRSRA